MHLLWESSAYGSSMIKLERNMNCRYQLQSQSSPGGLGDTAGAKSRYVLTYLCVRACPCIYLLRVYTF